MTSCRRLPDPALAPRQPTGERDGGTAHGQAPGGAGQRRGQGEAAEPQDRVAGRIKRNTQQPVAAAHREGCRPHVDLVVDPRQGCVKGEDGAPGGGRDQTSQPATASRRLTSVTGRTQLRTSHTSRLRHHGQDDPGQRHGDQGQAPVELVGEHLDGHAQQGRERREVHVGLAVDDEALDTERSVRNR